MAEVKVILISKYRTISGLFCLLLTKNEIKSGRRVPGRRMLRKRQQPEVLAVAAAGMNTIAMHRNQHFRNARRRRVWVKRRLQNYWSEIYMETYGKTAEKLNQIDSSTSVAHVFSIQ